MNHSPVPFSVEPMSLADIPAVVAIEHASYSMTWPAKAYDYELQENDLAHYFVLRTSLPHPPQKKSRDSNHQSDGQKETPDGGQRSQSEAAHSQRSGPQPKPQGDAALWPNESSPRRPVGAAASSSVSRPSLIIGLAGFWLMADEAHISTIAIHPDWRGLGLGEWLLLTLIEVAHALGAQTATLEVRPSNHSALALYQKYRFEQVGRRPRYYSDNNEDALILTTPPLALPDYRAMLSQYRGTLFQRLTNLP